MTDQVQPDTVEFIYEHTKAAPQRQLEAIHALDGKLVNVFSVASIVISLGGLTVTEGQVDEAVAVKAALAAAVGLYILAAIAAVLGLWIKRARETDQADNLWRQYWNSRPEEIKYALVADIADAFAWNANIIRSQARWVKASLALTGVETMLVGLSLIFARVA